MTRAPTRERGERGRILLLSGSAAGQLLANAVAATAATALLGPTQRGLMVIGLTVASTAAAAAALGTGSALRARLPTAVDPASRARLLAAFTWLSLAAPAGAAVLSCAVVAVSATTIDPGLGTGPFLAATGVFAAGQVLALQTAETWFADGEFRAAGASVAGIAAAGLLGLLLAASSGSAAGLLLGQGAGQLAAGALVVGRLWRHGLVATAVPDTGTVAVLLRQGVPALGMTLGLAVALRTDRYLLGLVVGPAAVGVYSLAATLSEVLRVVPQAMGQLFLRDAARAAGPEHLLARSSAAVGASAVTAAVAGAASWFLVVPLFGPDFAEARPLLLPLFAAEVLFAPYAVASRGILGRGHSRDAALIGLGAAAVAVVGYLVGARLGGAQGLAASCMPVYAAMSVAAVLAFSRGGARQVAA